MLLLRRHKKSLMLLRRHKSQVNIDKLVLHKWQLTLQVPYSGFAMMTRVAACIGISRTIRTIAFMLTVLPSPRPGCYKRRFPPVPDTWSEYLKIGFGQMRGMGGCNDLIIR